MNRFALTIPALASALAFASDALAGEQYVDDSGFAASGFDVVAYFDLPQAAVGAAQPQAVPGKLSITASYNGAEFAFANADNRAAFLANPEKYVPQYDGHCAFGVSKGGKVPGNPQLWRIVDGKLYLNITENVAGFWEADIPGNISRAENNWVGIEPAPASDRAIPNYSSPAPLK